MTTRIRVISNDTRTAIERYAQVNADRCAQNGDDDERRRWAGLLDLIQADDCHHPASPVVVHEQEVRADDVRCRICGGIGGKHDGASHDARSADMPSPEAIAARTPEADRG